MKLASKAVLALVCCAAVFLVACGGAFSTPENTLKTYAEAIKSKNIDKMIECHIKKEQEEMNKKKADLEKDAKEGKGELLSYEVGSAKIEGDKATCKLTMNQKNKEGKENKSDMEFVLIKEEGNWKISMEDTMKKLLNLDDKKEEKK